jgi:5'-nucleotidase
MPKPKIPAAKKLTPLARTVTSVALIALAAPVALSGCTHGGHRPPELEAAQASARGQGSGEIATIAILGTNDIHGALAPQELKTRESDDHAPVAYRAGGVAALASYVRELRSEFGSSLLWLDGGDEFQGSIESNQAQGAPLVRFFNQMGLQAAAIGNHEFDYGALKPEGAGASPAPEDRLGALRARIAEARYPYLAANIRDRATGELATRLLPGLAAHQIFDTGKLKVGVFGLTTVDTPRTTLSTNVRDLSFADLKSTALAESAELRREGADVVVLVAHAGGKCERGRSSAASHVRTPTEPQGECGPHDEIVQLLKSVPSGTIDAVVAGHTHQVMHHWIAGVPVIEGGAFGRYFNVIYLNYDLSAHRLVTDRTRVEGPVPVCPLVFQNQGDCNGDRPAPRAGRGPLVAPVFHGAKMREDSDVQRMLEPVYARTAAIKHEAFATLARPVEHERFRESGLGDLVADAMREATGAPVALMNSGGVRAPWEAGPLTFESIFRTLPFDNQVIAVRVTGRELKTILRIAESGSRGFFSVSGVRIRLIPPDEDAPGSDLDGDGKIDVWEDNRIRGIELEDGSPIQDDREYRLATLDFLLSGGDDLGWIMKQIPLQRQDPPAGLLREAVLRHLRLLAKSGPINTAERPLINPAAPRLKFERTPAKGKKGHRRHRRSRRGKKA